MDSPTPASHPSRRRESSNRRSIRRLLALVAIGAVAITGCAWLTGTGTESAFTAATDPPATTSASTSTTTGSDPIESVQQATATSTADTTEPEVEALSAEELDVESRISAASIEPGSCGTVAYTPETSSSVQVGELCVPAEQTESTAIALVHGGGGMGGSRTDLAAWQRTYSDLGYVTFSIDYQLSDPDNPTEGGIWPAPEQDVKASIQFLRLASSTLGTDQIVVQGHSAGARLGGIVLTTPDDPSFQGRGLWTEVSDAADGFIGFYGYYNGFQFEWDAYYGKGVEEPSASDATANAKGASGPALLIIGNSDSMVEPEESNGFAAALAASGQDAKLVSLEGRNHGFDQSDGELTTDGHAIADQIHSWIGSHVLAG